MVHVFIIRNILLIYAYACISSEFGGHLPVYHGFFQTKYLLSNLYIPFHMVAVIPTTNNSYPKEGLRQAGVRS